MALKCLAQTSEKPKLRTQTLSGYLEEIPRILEPLLSKSDSRASVLGTLMRFE